MLRSLLFFFLWPFSLSFLGDLVKGAAKVFTGATSGDWFGLGTSLLGGFLGSSGAEDAMDFSSAASAEMMDFQKDMYKKRYQYQMEDMRKAGLNPMLSYMQAPPNGPPGAQPAHIENKGLAATTAANAVNQTRLLGSQVENVKSQTMLNSATAEKELAIARATTAQAGIGEIDLATKTFLRDHGNLFVNARSIDNAKGAISMYEQFKANNDWNALQYLNEMAVDSGFRNFYEAVDSTSFRQSLVNLQQTSLKFPQLHSEANMWRSDYGRNVAPYVNSASSIAGSASGLGGAVTNALRVRKFKDWSRK